MYECEMCIFNERYIEFPRMNRVNNIASVMHRVVCKWRSRSELYAIGNSHRTILINNLFTQVEHIWIDNANTSQRSATWSSHFLCDFLTTFVKYPLFDEVLSLFTNIAEYSLFYDINKFALLQIKRFDSKQKKNGSFCRF